MKRLVMIKLRHKQNFKKSFNSVLNPGFGQGFFIFQIKSSCLILCNIFIIPDLTNIWYYAFCEFAPDIFVGRKICYNETLKYGCQQNAGIFHIIL